MKVKEISRENLGIPCNWDIKKCPYFKNGLDLFNNKLNCSYEYGSKCNGVKYKVLYEIDGEKYQVIEHAELAKPLEHEIDIEMSKEYLLEGFKRGESLDHILMWNSIRNEYK